MCRVCCKPYCGNCCSKTKELHPTASNPVMMCTKCESIFDDIVKLHYAAQCGDNATVCEILDKEVKGVSCKTLHPRERVTVLYTAAKAGCVDTCKLLCEQYNASLEERQGQERKKLQDLLESLSSQEVYDYLCEML
eukprot:PhF_6_TR22327/c0_g1_i1/m.31610